MSKPIMKKPAPADPMPAAAGPFADRDFEADYPMLHAFLCCTRWEDGTPRQTSTLLFFVEDGQLKGCLNDRAGERSAFFAAPTWGDLLATIEARLVDDRVEWRVRRQPKRD